MPTITDTSLQAPVSQYDELNTKIETSRNITHEKIESANSKINVILAILLIAIPSAIGAFFYIQGQIHDMQLQIHDIQNEIQTISSTLQQVLNKLQ